MEFQSLVSPSTLSAEGQKKDLLIFKIEMVIRDSL